MTDNEKRKVEFKVKSKATWEDSPVLLKKNSLTLAKVEEQALLMSKLFKEEVRWNWAGESQGHYVSYESEE